MAKLDEVYTVQGVREKIVEESAHEAQKPHNDRQSLIDPTGVDTRYRQLLCYAMTLVQSR